MLEKAQDQRGELTCCWEPKGSYFKFYYNFRKFSWDSSAFWFWVQTNRLKRSSQTQLQYAMRNMHSHYEDCSCFLRKRRSAVADLSVGMKWMFEQHLDIQSAERKLTVLLQPMSGDHWERSCKGWEETWILFGALGCDWRLAYQLDETWARHSLLSKRWTVNWQCLSER